MKFRFSTASVALFIKHNGAITIAKTSRKTASSSKRVLREFRNIATSLNRVKKPMGRPSRDGADTGADASSRR